MYKFVCDPDALFQMALAENHRNALKAEAASVLKSASSGAGQGHGGGHGHGGHQGHGQRQSRQHEYSDMLNQASRHFKGP